MKFVRVPVIRNGKEHEFAVRRLKNLLQPTSSIPKKDPDEIHVISLVVDGFEQAQFPQKRFRDPVAAILFRMKQMGLTAADLIPIVGSQSAVSRILNGKQLSLHVIRIINRKLKVPAEALIKPLRSRKRRAR